MYSVYACLEVKEDQHLNVLQYRGYLKEKFCFRMNNENKVVLFYCEFYS